MEENYSKREECFRGLKSWKCLNFAQCSLKMLVDVNSKLILFVITLVYFCFYSGPVSFTVHAHNAVFQFLDQHFVCAKKVSKATKERAFRISQ